VTILIDTGLKYLSGDLYGDDARAAGTGAARSPGA
jgi:hypothetical protein